MQRIDITEQEAPQRVDRFLTKYLNKTGKSTVYRLIRKKIIRVNGKRIKENYTLQIGDELVIYLADDSFDELREEPRKISPQKAGLDIVFEDDEILVLNKPVGLLTHPDKLEYKNTLATKVHLYLADLCGKTFKPAPIQRLDKNTSGLVLFAKTYGALQEYNTLMRERKLGKFYQCVVEGRVKKAGEVKGYLIKDHDKNRVSISKIETADSQFVETLFSPIEVFDNYTLLEVELKTGRSHQIRVSLSSIGYPIVGDMKYGGNRSGRYRSQLLHAYKLVLPNGKVITRDSDEILNFIEDQKSSYR
jgi:23S rRNA pseudouridine955/2504/2580 synthase